MDGKGGISAVRGHIVKEASELSRMEVNGMAGTARSCRIVQGYGCELTASSLGGRTARSSAIVGTSRSERMEELHGRLRSVTNFEREIFKGAYVESSVDGVPWLCLEVGQYVKQSVHKDFSLLQGYSKQESSSGLKALDLTTTVLSKDTVEASDALCFTYHKRTTSYKRGFIGGTGSEHVQIPFLQFKREGSAKVNQKGGIELGQDAVVTEVSLSDVTRGSIKGSANYLFAKNNHNLDAGYAEIVDGIRQIGKGVVADELAHGFFDAMSRRGYPAKEADIAYRFVVKPLYRALNEKGWQSALNPHELPHELGGLFTRLKDAAVRDPKAFALDALNTAAPLLGSDLRLQWDESYKGFNMFGYGAGIGTQVDTGSDRTVVDTGLHASKRFRSTLHTVGASGCLGKSVETIDRHLGDGTGHLTCTSQTLGVRAKGDILGVDVAEIRAGYVRSEQSVQEQASIAGLPGVKETQTNFSGLGAEGRLGPGPGPSNARLEARFGWTQESSVGTSMDGSAEYLKDVSSFGAAGGLHVQDGFRAQVLHA